MRGYWLVILVWLPCLTGCLNPDLVNQTVGGLYPTAPGGESFVLVHLINDTSATLDVPIVWDDGSQPTHMYHVRGPIIPGTSVPGGLTPGGHDTGLLLDWPIVRVALGNLDNPLDPAIEANYIDSATGALIRSIGVPFGHPALQAGVDFNRGDTIIFDFTEDSRSSAFILVSVGLISGAEQTGTFSRGNPFERLQLLLQTTGF